MHADACPYAMSSTASPPSQPAVRKFGRYEIRLMIGRSQASGVWLAFDPRMQHEVLLLVPRSAPTQAAEREAWVQEVQSGARLQHPRLAEVMEVTLLDTWPFASVAREGRVTLLERLANGPVLTPQEVASIACDVLEGLAYAHEAGRAHHDLALHHILLDKSGRATLAGLGCGLLRPLAGHPSASPGSHQQTHREATERDLLMMGLLMHRLLANAWPLDDHDIGHAADRVGPEIVRLPFNTPHPVPETLRAIVNRATDRQQRQRYLNARTLLSALQGWIKTNTQDDGGPLLLLLDRLNAVGALPGRPHTERALVGALSQESLRVEDFVDVVLLNPAMSWEMMRAVNTASYRSSGSDEGVTTLSRAVLLLGQQGVRKLISSLRTWPGALAAKASVDQELGLQAQGALERELRTCCLAGHIARWIAPFELSDEECALAAMSQRLGWLLVLYHFPDEAAQMKRLMLPGPPAEQGGAPTPGMSLEGAAAAVLGINLDDLTLAVLKHWGWDDRLAQAARPLSRTAGVRHPASTDEMLRTVASLSNEIASTQDLAMDKAVSAMHQIQLRYARPLNLEARECQATLDHAVKLIDRPVKAEVDDDAPRRKQDVAPDGQAALASAGAPSAQAVLPASNASNASSVSPARPDLPTMADTSPAPLMPAGTLSGGTSGGLRARLQGRGVTR
jgi:HD-like signal output (HDOD) protein